jgi:transposase-like protein
MNGTVALVDDGFRQAELMRRYRRRVPPPQSGFAGFRFPREVIMLAVRWYLRYGLSYRNVEELLAERGITVNRSCLVHTLRPHGQCAAPHAGQDSG